MREMSHFLQSKYKYFSNIIDFNRKEYFTHIISCRGHQDFHYLTELVHIDEHDPDADVFIYRFEVNEFFIFMQYIQSKQFEIMAYWNEFNKGLRRIQKRFEQKRRILKLLGYKQILQQHFCIDISELITTFIL